MVFLGVVGYVWEYFLGEVGKIGVNRRKGSRFWFFLVLGWFFRILEGFGDDF